MMTICSIRSHENTMRNKEDTPKRSSLKRFLLPLGIVVASLATLGAIGALLLVMWASQGLPNFTQVADYRPPQVTKVYARDGSLIAQFYKEKRYLIGLNDMASHVPKAFLAAEDDSFYEHEGIDPIAIIRAFIINMQAGSIKQGGSTITQQIVKRLLLSSERSYKRKIKEAILAYRLESYLTKDEILSIYLNQIYLGGGAYGVEAAARTFFGKHAAELSIAEAAILAAMPQAPSKYNPLRNPEEAKKRQHYVLRRMHELEWITPEEYEAALNEPLVYKNMDDTITHVGATYVEEVRRQLIAFLTKENIKRHKLPIGRVGEDAVYKEGLHIYTAMDTAQQLAAESSLRKGLEAATRRHGWFGAIESIEQGQYESFLEQNPFTPDALMGGNWAKALVTKVTKKGAYVRLGEYEGFIPVKTMHWCRTPNVKVATDHVPSIKNAHKVLKQGDVVWVSGLGSDGKSSTFNAAAIEPGDKLTLALQQYPTVQGAIVSIEPRTGDVVSMAGGYSFSDSQFNRAIQAFRQPGSSFKPIVYSAALDNGFTAGSVVLDAPVVYINNSTDEVWRPNNFEGNFTGPMLLRTALVKSRNMCTIRIAQEIGITKIIDQAKKLGLTPHFPQELAVSLGAVAVSPINMAQAYTAFANGGRTSQPRLIIDIKDQKDTTIYTYEPVIQDAISPENAYIMASLLKEVVQDGTARRAKVLTFPVAGKTGTSNDERDAWFIGFTPNLVTAVYVGYDQVAPMGKYETGSRAALPIFINYHQSIEGIYPPDDFPVPPTITFARVDGRTGLLAGPSSLQQFTLPFIEGTQPTVTSEEQLQRGEDAVRSGEELLKQLF